MFEDQQLNQVIEQLSPIKVLKEHKPTREKKRIKRDALWKPLLRKFRQWVRSLMSKDPNGAGENELSMDIGCHYWSFKRMKQKVVEMMVYYNMPQSLKNDEVHVFEMILLLFPTMATKTN